MSGAVQLAADVMCYRDDRFIKDTWYLVRTEWAYNASRGDEAVRIESESHYSSPMEALIALEAESVVW